MKFIYIISKTYKNILYKLESLYSRIFSFRIIWRIKFDNFFLQFGPSGVRTLVLQQLLLDKLFQNSIQKLFLNLPVECFLTTLSYHFSSLSRSLLDLWRFPYGKYSELLIDYICRVVVPLLFHHFYSGSCWVQILILIHFFTCLSQYDNFHSND